MSKGRLVVCSLPQRQEALRQAQLKLEAEALRLAKLKLEADESFEPG